MKPRRIPANRGQKLPPEVLTVDEVQLLLRACSDRAPTGIRNRALIGLLWRAGLRLNEALSLQPKDIDPAKGTIFVAHGKGDRSRTVGCDSLGFALLQRWLDHRRELDLPARAPIFCTLKGGKLPASYIRTLLPRLAAKAGIEKRVHAHGLRHTLASELADEGLPMKVIQKQLGHKRLATTELYIQDLNPRRLLELMQARPAPVV